MKTKDWQRHLRELVGPRFDPAVTVYGLKWANDPHCARALATRKRIGEAAPERAPGAGLWSTVVAK